MGMDAQHFLLTSTRAKQTCGINTGLWNHKLERGSRQCQERAADHSKLDNKSYASERYTVSNQSNIQ